MQGQMTIHDPKLTFRTWLHLASFQTVRFAQNYVRQKLAYDFRYELQLNMAVDDFAEGAFELYPEDDDRVVQCYSPEEVIDELVRDDRIPVWIDISAFKHARDFTVLRLICAGRFTDDVGELYYYARGTGCFGIKSPNLPPGWREGQKFKIEKA